MNDRIMNWPVKWAGELSHVREVTILGTADLSFWSDWLVEQNLRPAELEGKAQLLIVGADSKFMGISFRELSFSVLVATQQSGAQPDAAYLVRAFNSSRLLTFCEQVFFSTPYCPADVRVSANLPVSVHVVQDGEVLFGAQMQTDASGSERQASHDGEDGWEGPIFLPRSSGGKGGNGKVFFARLRGDTNRYPFLLSQDSMTIKSSSDFDIFQALAESHYVATEWVVREDATHARSKTFKTANVLPEMIDGEANAVTR